MRIAKEWEKLRRRMDDTKCDAEADERVQRVVRKKTRERKKSKEKKLGTRSEMRGASGKISDKQ